MMQLRQTLAEVVLLKKRVSKMALDNTMMGLVNDEILPTMEAFMEAAIEDLSELRRDFDDLEDAVLDTENDAITPETSAALIGLIELGMTVCDLIVESGIKLENDLLNKKLNDAIAEFQRAAIVNAQHVINMTLDPDEEDDDDSDSDDEKTPVEIPHKKETQNGTNDRNRGERDDNATTTEAEAE